MAQLLPLRCHRAARGQLRHADGDLRSSTRGAADAEQLLDAIAISVDGPKAWDLDLAFDLTFTDLDLNYRLTVRNGVLVYVEKPAADGAPLTIRLTKARMLAMLGGDTDGPGVALEGDAGVLQSLLGVLDRGDPSFEIVVP